MMALPERDRFLSPASLPWAAMGFALVSLLVLVFWQGGSRQTEQALLDGYQQDGLAAMEWPVYLSHLRLRGDVTQAARLQSLHSQDNQQEALRQPLYDRKFFNTLAAEPERYWDDQVMNHWLQQREQVNSSLRALPAVRAGLQPVAPAPASFLTFHFLSPGMLHWLIVVLVLLPFAWALEGSLGSLRTLLIWPLAAIIAGAAGTFLLRQHVIPITGGSVMASAMAGMYLGYFGKRRIRFGLPRRNEWLIRMAPAALLLPLWLLLPLLALLSNAAPGIWLLQLLALVSGALLIQLVHLPDMSALLDRDDDNQETAVSLREQLTGGWAALGTMAFAEAEKRFLAACKLAPNNFNAVNGLYQTRKLKPADTSWLATVQRLLKMPLEDPAECRQQQMAWREASKILGDKLVLSDATRWQLVANMSRIDSTTDAESLAATTADTPASEQQAIALQQLGEALSRKGNRARAGHFLALAERASQAAADAREAEVEAVERDRREAKEAEEAKEASQQAIEKQRQEENRREAEKREQEKREEQQRLEEQQREDQQKEEQQAAEQARLITSRTESADPEPQAETALQPDQPQVPATTQPADDGPQDQPAQASEASDLTAKPTAQPPPAPALDKPRATFAARDPETPALEEIIQQAEAAAAAASEAQTETQAEAEAEATGEQAVSSDDEQTDTGQEEQGEPSPDQQTALNSADSRNIDDILTGDDSDQGNPEHDRSTKDPGTQADETPHRD